MWSGRSLPLGEPRDQGDRPPSQTGLHTFVYPQVSVGAGEEEGGIPAGDGGRDDAGMWDGGMWAPKNPGGWNATGLNHPGGLTPRGLIPKV